MAEQFGEKKHEATLKRRQDARQEGRVAKSQDLASATVLLGSILVLMAMGEIVTGRVVGFLERTLGGDAWLQADSEMATSVWLDSLMVLAQVSLPLAAITLVIAFVANVFQTGLVLSPKNLAPDIKKVNPLSGFRRLFGLSNVVRVLFGLGKILIVAAIAAISIWGDLDRFANLPGTDVRQLIGLISDLTLWTSLKIAIALVILALLDFFYQRWKFEQDLRMTDQELREELKSTQGDPAVLARRRAIQREMVKNRTVKAVPDADTVITNPTELAVAIKYDMETMAAPIVVAKGAGMLAQQIRRIALENSIPIVERKELAQLLYREVDLNQPIPQEQYAAVAEVLRYVYELKGKTLPPADDQTSAA
jgi:flagellar biosynthetic protein FlhB